MPVKTPASNLKGTSPSKSIQRGNDQSWGSQQGYTSPQQALNDKHTKNPVPVNGNGK